MRRRLLPLVLFLGATLGVTLPARGDSRVSLEVGGVLAYSPLEVAGAAPAERQINLAGSTSMTSSSFRPSDGIVGAEVRPSFVLGKGLRIGIGFRAGSTAGARDGAKTTEATLVGGDLSLGYGRWLWSGRFLPFVEARFGFNNYSVTVDGVPASEQQLRLDAVLGARVYLTQAAYLLASGFVGWGDRYGGTVALGFDLVHYRMRGALP